MKIRIPVLSGILVMALGTHVMAQIANGTQLTPQEREKTKVQRAQGWDERKATHVAVIDIAAQTYKKGKPKGDFHRSTVESYNQEGQLASWAFYSRKGKLLTVNAYEYDAHGNMTGQSCSSGKQKLLNRQAYTYTNDLLMASMAFRGKKDKAVERRTFEYNPGGWVLATKTVRPKNEKLISRTVCSYHEDGSKKRVEKYNGKGALVTATDYACDQSGKTLSASNAQEINVCERFELNTDGKTVRIVETIWEDKERYRTVVKFNDRNRLLESVTYNPTGEILSKFGYTYDEAGQVLSMASHGKGGILNYKSVYERDAEGRTTFETRENGQGEVLVKQRFSYTLH